MISTDFAPNESWDDAFLSLKLLFQPWKWKKGGEINKAKEKIVKLFVRKEGESKFLRDYMSERSELSRVKNYDEPSINVTLFLTGRSALYHLLKSLNLSKNSAILVQAFTCEAVVLPILANDLKPIYVDIETKTFSMDLTDLEKKANPRCKVLILQHTFGLTPKFRLEIIKFAQTRKLIVIEDIAHGFSNNLTMKQFNNSFLLLSFGRSKALSSVFGGGIVGPNNPTMQQLGNAVNHLQFPSYGFILRLLMYKPLSVLIKSTYDFFIGKLLHRLLVSLDLLVPEITRKEKRGEFEPILNKAYPNALAILLNNQINKYSNMQDIRTEACQKYQKELRQFLNYGLRITNYGLVRYPFLVENRDEIITRVKKQNVFLGKWYDQVVAPKGLDLEKLEYKKGSCPVAEEACQKIINLPTLISNKEIDIIFRLINNEN